MNEERPWDIVWAMGSANVRAVAPFRGAIKSTAKKVDAAISMPAENLTTPLVVYIGSDTESRSSIVGTLAGYYKTLMFGDATSAVLGLRKTLCDLIIVDELVQEYPERDQICDGWHFARQIATWGGTQTPVVIATCLSPLDAYDRLKQTRHVKDCILKKQPPTDAFARVALVLERYKGIKRPAASFPPPYRPRIVSVGMPHVPQGFELRPATSRALEKTAQVFNIAQALSVGEVIRQNDIQEACTFLVEAVDQGEVTDVITALKEHDNYTYAHSVKASVLLTLFWRGLGMDREQQVILGTGGYLHDVGKQLIPQEVLNKPWKFKPHEWDIMKGHVDKTIELISQIRGLHPATALIAAQHHENLDGTGYPKGLKGNEIKELARMAAIVDRFTALTDARTYKPARTAEDAFNLMTNQDSEKIDIGLLKKFMDVFFAHGLYQSL